MAFLVGGANSLSAAYSIENSLRFNGESAELTREQDAGNRKTWTCSFWTKILPTTGGSLWGTPSEGDQLYFSGNQLYFFNEGSSGSYLSTVRLFRDPSAWYHLVIAYDTTQGTAANRVKLYINGSQYTWDDDTTYPDEDDEFKVCNDGDNFRINAGHANVASGGSQYYYADFAFIDGTAYAASDFGETDSDSGIWKPKVVTGLTFGTNGFFLEFKQSGTSQNSSGMGADTSGNDNHFAVTDLAAADQTTDTPTNNFCTLNPLQITSSSTLTEGNTKHTNDGANDQAVAGTMGFANGKWYWEVKCVDKGEVGINLASDILQLSNDSAVGSNDANIKATSLITNSAGGSNDLRHNGSDESITSVSVSDNDIINIAVDADNGKIWFGKAGTWFGSGDPAAGSNESKDFSGEYTSGNFITPVATLGTGDGDILEFNFGNPPFSISSSQADDNGYGNFEYDVPAGFYALCSKNLAEFGG